MRNEREFLRVLWAVAALIAAGCHDSHTTLSAGSESHFLERCSSDAACGVLDCIADVCTRECTSEAACDDLSGATCREGVCGPSRQSSQPMKTANSDQVDGGTVRALPDGAVGAGTHCDFETNFDGDDACLEPPPPELGIQIHIGPGDYDDPEEIALWQLEPGEEISECWPFTADRKSTFTHWEFSARHPSFHQAVFDLQDDATGESCAPLPDAEPTPPAPGRLTLIQARDSGEFMPAVTVTQSSHVASHLHTLDYTDRPVLKELWLNLYY